MSLRILHLEDDLKDAELIQMMLRAGGIACEFVRVETEAEFISDLGRDSFDLILADFNLPQFDGLSALSIHAEKCPAIPFVFVSGTIGEELAIESLKNGATDYVLKQKLSRLVPAVQRALAEAEERKKRKAAEDMFRAALEASPNGVLMADAEGKIVLVNPKMLELFGYKAEELIGERIEILVPQRSREKHAKHHAGYMNNPQVRPVGMGRDLFAVRKDGTEFPVEIGLNPLTLGGKQMILAAIIDITERKRSEQALRQSEERLRELAENIREVFFVTGPSGSPVYYVSPAYEQITGHGRDALYQDPRAWLENIHPEDRPRIEQALKDKPESGDEEYRILRPEGAIRWVRTRSFPVNDSNGNIVRIVGIAEDITERKRAERKVQQNLERIRALHEIDLAITSTLDLTSVLYVLLENLNRFLPYPSASDIRLLNKETGLLEPAACLNVSLDEWKPAMLGSGAALGKEIMENRAPLVIADLQSDPRTRQISLFRKHGLVSFLGVPLIAKDDCLGILGYYTKEKREFTDEEIEFLSTLAGQAAIAINNAQLYQHTKTQTRDLQRAYEDLGKQEQIQRVLKELSQDITALELPDLLQKLTDVARNFLKVDICDIRISEADTTRVMAASGIELEKLRSRDGQGRTRLRTYTEKRVPIRVSDLSKDRDRVSEGSTALLLGIRGYLGAPFLSRDGRFFGIMRALSYLPKDFTQQEADLLQQLANGAAIAIENARLYRDLEASNNVKNEFLNVMSHELRTPLVAIVGYTALMEDEVLGKNTAEQAKAIRVIHKSTDDLIGMVEAILDVTKIEAGSLAVQKEAVDLKILLDDLREAYSVPLGKPVTLTWNYNCVLPILTTDAGKLKQILQNLINNAIKFTPQGEVRISAKLLSEINAIEFAVADTGIGITKELLPLLFERFRQGDSSSARPYEGMGLGLYIVKQFTELLGGKVRVESKDGRGSLFTVLIPCENEPAKA